MTFFVGETLTGTFIEIINAFCASSGYTPQYEVVSDSAALAGLSSGTYDLDANAVLRTEERLASVNITDELSAMLIRHVLKDISFSYEEGICRIDAELVM